MSDKIIEDMNPKNRIELLESALRGIQGIEFEDGYRINVAELKEDKKNLENILEQVISFLKKEISQHNNLLNSDIDICDFRYEQGGLSDCQRILKFINDLMENDNESNR